MLEHPKLVAQFWHAEKNHPNAKQYHFLLKEIAKGLFGDFLRRKHKAQNSMNLKFLNLAFFWILQNWFDQFWQQQNVALFEFKCTLN